MPAKGILTEKDANELLYADGRWRVDDELPLAHALGPLGWLVWRTMQRFGGRRPYRRLIDVGGGEGYFASRWPAADDKVVVDILAAALLIACARGVSGVAGDARRLPVKNGAADLVVCSDVLEHLDEGDVLAALRELARVCAPGGVTILHTSCYGFYLRRWLRPAPRRGPLDADDLKDGHRNRLRRKVLEAYIT